MQNRQFWKNWAVKGISPPKDIFNLTVFFSQKKNQKLPTRVVGDPHIFSTIIT